MSTPRSRRRSAVRPIAAAALRFLQFYFMRAGRRSARPTCPVAPTVSRDACASCARAPRQRARVFYGAAQGRVRRRLAALGGFHAADRRPTLEFGGGVAGGARLNVLTRERWAGRRRSSWPSATGTRMRSCTQPGGSRPPQHRGAAGRGCARRRSRRRSLLLGGLPVPPPAERLPREPSRCRVRDSDPQHKELSGYEHPRLYRLPPRCSRPATPAREARIRPAPRRTPARRPARFKLPELLYTRQFTRLLAAIAAAVATRAAPQAARLLLAPMGWRAVRDPLDRAARRALPRRRTRAENFKS